MASPQAHIDKLKRVTTIVAIAKQLELLRSVAEGQGEEMLAYLIELAHSEAAWAQKQASSDP